MREVRGDCMQLAHVHCSEITYRAFQRSSSFCLAAARCDPELVTHMVLSVTRSDASPPAEDAER